MTTWIILFYVALCIILLTLIRRGWIHSRTAQQFDPHHETIWTDVRIKLSSLERISVRSIGRMVSFGLYIIVTVFEELLHRIIHVLRGCARFLVSKIDAYERKHHNHPSHEHSPLHSIHRSMSQYSQNE